MSKSNEQRRQGLADKIAPKLPNNELPATFLEEMMLFKEAGRLLSCTRNWRSKKCQDCGEVLNDPLTCGSVLCDECRKRRLKAFFAQHFDELAPWQGCVIFSFSTTPKRLQEGWQSEAEETWKRLKQGLRTIWKQFKRKGWLDGCFYHRRPCFGPDSWAIAFYLFVPSAHYEEEYDHE